MNISILAGAVKWLLKDLPKNHYLYQLYWAEIKDAQLWRPVWSWDRPTDDRLWEYNQAQGREGVQEIIMSQIEIEGLLLALLKLKLNETDLKVIDALCHAHLESIFLDEKALKTFSIGVEFLSGNEGSLVAFLRSFTYAGMPQFLLVYALEKQAQANQ